MRRMIIVLAVTVLLPAAGALADPGDPVTNFGSGGVVTIPPRSYPFVGPGDLVVTADGTMVLDVGDGDVDFGFAAARIDASGNWEYLDAPFETCASERAALGADGSVFFGGNCENGTFLVRFTPELTLDTEWGDAATPGVVWDRELGRMPLLSVDETRIAHVIGEGDELDPVLSVRDYSGALLGEVAIDPPNPAEELWLLALFPGPGNDFLTIAVVQETSIAVISSALGQGSTLVDATEVSAPIVDAEAIQLGSGDLLVAYTVAAGPTGDEIHLMRIGGDGQLDDTFVSPALGVPMTDTDISLAELRTGDLAVLTTDGYATRVDRFTPDGAHRNTLVSFEDSPTRRATWTDLAVHPHDGSLLHVRDVRDFAGSFVEIHRFEGDTLGRFVDDEHTVFITAIEWLANEGITRGCNPPRNDNYCPDDTVTRGEMAAFISRAFALPRPLPRNTFLDDDDSIFEAEIEKLAAAGITRGCNPPDNDRFCPDEPVTRGQMAAFLVRALGLTDRGSIDFVDDDTSVFEADIEKLARAGITRGCNPPDNDRYCPEDPMTRGQMAAVLHRALGGGRLSGHVFEDADIDGVYDAGEAPIQGVTVYLSGTVITRRTAVTDARGGYAFGPLQPGEYLVEVPEQARPPGSLATNPAGHVVDITDTSTHLDLDLGLRTPDGMEDALVGSWSGTNANPWVDPYQIEIEFKADRTYSSQTDAEHWALYFGPDDDTPLKTYTVTSIDSLGVGKGEIALYWLVSDTVRMAAMTSIEFTDADHVTIELWDRGQYGPVILDLTRSGP